MSTVVTIKYKGQIFQHIVETTVKPKYLGTYKQLPKMLFETCSYGNFAYIELIDFRDVCISYEQKDWK